MGGSASLKIKGGTFPRRLNKFGSDLAYWQLSLIIFTFVTLRSAC
jgi:hypothetical protein